MTRFLLSIFILGLVYVQKSNANFNCNSKSSYPATVCRQESCMTKIKNQIDLELDAAFEYMYMAAHFAQDTVDRPGISKLFFEAASEERSHANYMLDYLNNRGIKYGHLAYSFGKTEFQFAADAVTDYKAALKHGADMEITVTNAINAIIDECTTSGKEDFHGADVFTNPILDEQYQGMRKLQGALKAYDDLNQLPFHTIPPEQIAPSQKVFVNQIISSQEAYITQHKDFAEYVFDRKLLNGEI